MLFGVRRYTAFSKQLTALQVAIYHKINSNSNQGKHIVRYSTQIRIKHLFIGFNHSIYQSINQYNIKNPQFPEKHRTNEIYKHTYQFRWMLCRLYSVLRNVVWYAAYGIPGKFHARSFKYSMNIQISSMPYTYVYGFIRH